MATSNVIVSRQSELLPSSESEPERRPRRSFPFCLPPLCLPCLAIQRRSRQVASPKSRSSASCESIELATMSRLSLDFPYEPILYDCEKEPEFDLSPYLHTLIERLAALVQGHLADLPFSYPPCPSDDVSMMGLGDQAMLNIANNSLAKGLQLQENNEKATGARASESLAYESILMAAELGLPLALYWLAMSSRYGWNESEYLRASNKSEKEKSTRQSFACLVLAAYLSAFAAYNYQNGHKEGGKGSEPHHAALLASFRLSAILDFDPLELGLILGEIGSCYEYGLGVYKRNYAACTYYYGLSAGLGDPDSALAAGDVLSHGKAFAKASRGRRGPAERKEDKKWAAMYYRLAEKNGRCQWGWSWIHKAKWGGSLKESQETEEDPDQGRDQENSSTNANANANAKKKRDKNLNKYNDNGNDKNKNKSKSKKEKDASNSTPLSIASPLVEIERSIKT